MKKILKLLMISFVFSLPFTLCVQAAQETAVGEEAAKSSSSSIQPYASEELVNITIEGTENYDYAWEVLDLVNEEREKEGVGPLTMDQELMDAAMLRAAETQLYFSHTRPDGTTCWTACSKASGENIAANYSPESVMEAWMDSSGHRSNILNAGWTSIGVGCFTQGNVQYWVQMFSSSQAAEPQIYGSKNVTRSISASKDIVNLEITGVSSEPISISVVPDGQEISLGAVIRNAGWDYGSTVPAADSISWTSSDSSVVSVDMGKLTGQKNGNADIRAELKDCPEIFVEVPVQAYGLPDAVTGVKAATAGKNKVLLTWEPSSNAEGYLIYAQKNGSYGYCGMTTAGTRFTDIKALDTDYNFYWVFPYVTDSNGKMYPGAVQGYVYAKGVIPPVQNLKGYSISGGVRLTWDPQNDADGYLIYGIRAGSQYGYIGMTTTGTVFKDSKASKEDYNFYWVFPYHNKDGKMIVGGTPKYTYGIAL